MKRIVACLLGAVLILGPSQVFAAQKLPIVYVALGDSLAAGQTPNREIDAGYSDLIAQELSRNLPLAIFNKNLTFPGFTSSNILESVKAEGAQELLANANLITISSGANDLLQVLRTNPAAGTLSFQQIEADFQLNNVRKNTKELLLELKTRASGADIYVMGYYFPYPHLSEFQQEGAVRQLNLLNEILKQEAEAAGAFFVDVSGNFVEGAKEFIPNPADVHPNLQGYRMMANAFFNVFSAGRYSVSLSEIPEASPVPFEELIQGTRQEDTRKASALPSFSPNMRVTIEELHLS